MVLFGKSVLLVCIAAVATILTTASTIPPPTQTASTSLPTTTTTTSQVSSTTTEAVADTTAAATAIENDTEPTTTAAAVADDDTTEMSVFNVTDSSGNATDEAATTTTSTTTTTTAAPVPQPPFSCFDCHSGRPLPGMWRNKNCTIDGDDRWWSTTSYCDTFCFSVVGRFPAGTVFRGCASSLYLGNRVLEDGCFPDDSRKRDVCLCFGNLCNNHNMTELSQKYIRQHWMDVASRVH